MSYNNLYIKVICIVTLLCHCTNIVAQSKSNTIDLPIPKFILVELNTAHKQILAYKRAGNHKYAGIASADAKAVIDCMVADFNDNFNYCPVYYFFDTNAHLILQKHMDGVLLDTNLQPALIPKVEEGEYRIVKYGYNINTASNNSINTQSVNQIDGIQKKIIVLSPDYTIVPKPEPDGRNLAGPLYGLKPNRKYAHTSKKLQIYYRPKAKHLNSAFKRYFSQ